MARIAIRNLSKHYAAGALAALHDLSLDIDDNRFVTLLGPSGCGKTTTLRLIAGYVRPDGGSISVDGKVMSSIEGVVPPENRGMGMVFQNYAVWPHKTVFENVSFGLQVRRQSGEAIRTAVARVLDLVGLNGYEKRMPNELSGGQQQRVALARSLVVEPRILLLDEPLSNLDAKLRERMRTELKELQRRTAITFVYVTHDQAEALALSDDIAVMDKGELQQFGPPREIYTRPANRKVADFMGQVNFIPGRVTAVASGGSGGGGEGQVTIEGGPAVRVKLPDGADLGTPVDLAIRPENLMLTESGASPYRGQVIDLTFLGNLNEYIVGVAGDTTLKVQTHPSWVYEPGASVGIEFDGAHCTAFARQ